MKLITDIAKVAEAKTEVDGAITLTLDLVYRSIDETGNIVASESETGVIFTYVSTDPYSGALGVKVGQWISENPDKVSPYAPVVLTDEERRALMPRLTSRQFWMAAANVNIDKEVILAAIRASMEDSIERKMTIAELESSTFERSNPTVIDLMELMEIPAEQVDDLWVWASSL